MPDYLLSWVLAGIGRVDALRDTLIFKGGTALKKCCFGNYRFSEDLDFSAVDDVPAGTAMEEAIRQACAAAAERLDEYAPVEITCVQGNDSGSQFRRFTVQGLRDMPKVLI